jgi:hypothetical protein
MMGWNAIVKSKGSWVLSRQAAQPKGSNGWAKTVEIMGS